MTDQSKIELPSDAASLVTALRDALARKEKLAKEMAPTEELIEHLTERLKVMMGNQTVGTLNGKDVIRYPYLMKFDGDWFMSAEPQLAQQYVRPPTIDVAKVRKENPLLYRQFSHPSAERRFSLVTE